MPMLVQLTTYRSFRYASYWVFLNTHLPHHHSPHHPSLLHSFTPGSNLHSIVSTASAPLYPKHVGTLKPHSNGLLYSNTVIGIPAADDEWAVTFGTARRGPGGLGTAQSPPRCTKCNSPPINGQCTNFILFDVAL